MLSVASMLSGPCRITDKKLIFAHFVGMGKEVGTVVWISFNNFIR